MVKEINRDREPSTVSQAKTFAKTIPGYNEKYVVHHIVAKNAASAEPARDVLKSVGIDPYSNGLNLAIIPQSMHYSLHTANYYKYVNMRFEGLTGNREAIVWTLVALQIEIQLYCNTGLKAW